MANYTALEAVDMLDASFIDSEEESDIEEDPSFPLPQSDSESEDDANSK